MADKETIYGEVVSKANHYQAVPDKGGGKRIIKDKAIREYEANFMKQCKVYRNRNIDSEFIFNVDVFYTNRKHDLDNAIKTILDCLQYVGAITNDNLMMQLNARKFVVKYHPRIEFSIEKMQQSIF